jgi:uncharacterized protein (TIGR03086 family)
MEEKTMDVLGCLEEAESRLRELTSSLTEADLNRPTPCTEWDVRALLSHTIGAMEMYAAFADGGLAPDFEALMSGRDLLGGDPHGAALASCARSQQAWSQSGVLQRELATPWGPMSGERVASQSTFSTLVHGWDLAVALGLDAELPQHLLDLSWSFAEDLVPVLREVGVVAAPVEVGEGATPTQRLIAFLGRDPGGREGSASA